MARWLGFRDEPTSEGGIRWKGTVERETEPVGKMDPKILLGIDAADSGVVDLTGVITLVRNGATRIIYPAAQELNYKVRIVLYGVECSR